MKRLLFIILFLLVCGNVYAGMLIGSGIESGGGCATDSVDTENTGTTTSSVSLATDRAYGETFQLNSAGDISAIAVRIAFTSGGEAELRWGTNPDLTTFAASKTLTIGPDDDNTFIKFVFDTKVAGSASTDIYYALMENSGDVRISLTETNDYPAGQYTAAASAGEWNLTTTDANKDQVFKVYTCD